MSQVVGSSSKKALLLLDLPTEVIEKVIDFVDEMDTPIAFPRSRKILEQEILMHLSYKATKEEEHKAVQILNTDPNMPFKISSLSDISDLDELLEGGLKDKTIMELHRHVSTDISVPSATSFSSIQALSAVNKLLHQLVAPWKWSLADFEFCSDAHLLTFLDVIGENTKYVKTIWLRLVVERDEQRYMRMENRMGCDPVRRFDVLETLLRRCTSLESLDVDFYKHPLPEKRFALLQALKVRSETLEDLSISSQDEPNAPYEHEIAGILQLLPTLKGIRLQSIERLGNLNGPDSDLLVKALTSMQNLKSLELWDCKPFNGTWLQYDWPPLTHLKLDDCDQVDPETFDAFLARFSGSLWALAIDGTPATNQYVGVPLFKGVPPYDLPRLEVLTIGWLHTEIDFFKRFKNCPLNSVTIEDGLPLIDVFDFTEDFLQTHMETLKRVIIGESLEEEWLSHVKNWCKRTGVEFEVESDVSDTEESDDDISHGALEFDSDDLDSDDAGEDSFLDDLDEEEEQGWSDVDD